MKEQIKVVLLAASVAPWFTSCSGSSSSPAPSSPATSTSPSSGTTSTTSPSSPSTSPSTTTTATALSSVFASTCSSCHGTDGSAVPPGGTLAVLKGNTSYGQTAWDTAVRSGISGSSMVSFSTSTYTQAEEENDYTFLTGAAW